MFVYMNSAFARACKVLLRNILLLMRNIVSKSDMEGMKLSLSLGPLDNYV